MSLAQMAADARQPKSATELLSIIEAIEKTGKRAEKEALLGQFAQDEAGRDILRWTYDPFVTFGITPDRLGGQLAQDRSDPLWFRDMLQSLSTRELSGQAARDGVETAMKVASSAEAELMFRILSKDLKCGIGDKTVQKVVPGLFPVFAVMRAQKYERKRVTEFPVIGEPKIDGYRYTFIARNGTGGFFTRSGLRTASLDHLVRPALEAGEHFYGEWVDFVLDGEMKMPGDFNENGAIRREDQQAHGAFFNIFDMMTWEEFDASGSVEKSYMKRRQDVSGFVQAAEECGLDEYFGQTSRVRLMSHDEIDAFYAKMLEEGNEGAMIKPPAHGYDKKKSYGWLKIKPEETEDLFIVGAFPGKKHTKYENTLGGVIVRRQLGDGTAVLVYVAAFKDSLRDALWKAFADDRMRIDSEYWREVKRGGQVVDFEINGDENYGLIGRMIEVEFHEVTPDGSLRHPRFKRFRDDKAGEASK